MIIRNSKLRNKKVLSSIFEGNTFSVNFFLFLFILFFAVAGYDLSSELAKEKDEIDFVLDNLEESCNIPQLSPKGLDEITRPFEAAIPVTDSFISIETGLTLKVGRAPPAV